MHTSFLLLLNWSLSPTSIYDIIMTCKIVTSDIASVCLLLYVLRIHVSLIAPPPMKYNLEYLKDNLDEVVDNLRFEGNFLLHLVSYGVILDETQEEVKQILTRRSKAIQLMREILRGADDVRLYGLINALDDTQQSHIARIITEQGILAVLLLYMNVHFCTTAVKLSLVSMGNGSWTMLFMPSYIHFSFCAN